MGTLSARRGLEWLLGLYFLSHVPITLLLDLQTVLPRELYPVEVRAPVGPRSLGSLRALRLCPGVPMTSPSPSSGPPSPTQGCSSVFLRSCGCFGPSLPFNSTSPGFSLSIPDPSAKLLGAHTVPCKKQLFPGMFKALTPHLWSQLSVFEGSSLNEPMSKSRVSFVLTLCFLKEL